MKSRAYLMMNQIYKKQGNPEKQREILMEAREVLPIENQMIVLESLAQANIDLAESTGIFAYRSDAIEVIEQIISQGWDTYDTYNTLAILYQKQGKLNEARNTVDRMAENYDENYKTYMRYAFLEIDEQEMRTNESRDYSAFVQNYEMAADLYNKQMKDHNTDPEMQLLENVYMQVAEGVG